MSNKKTWAEIIENIQPDQLVEIPDANVFFRNKKLFMNEGFTLDVLDRLFPIIEQQMWSALALFCCAKQTPKNATILEIGSGRGGSIATIGMANPSAKLINIDKFSSYDEQSHAGVVCGYKGFEYNVFLKNVSSFNLDITTIKKWSEEAVDDIKDKSCDMIFIDGNHGYNHCKNDIINYSPKLKDDGILCGHDYHPRFPGVIQAVKELLSDYIVATNSSVWIRKERWMELKE